MRSLLIGSAFDRINDHANTASGVNPPAQTTYGDITTRRGWNTSGECQLFGSHLERADDGKWPI
jgi:hypothetical protein